MSLYNQLPPGLYGYVAAQQAGQQQEAQDLQRQMGIMQILQAKAAMEKQKREEALLAEKQKALAGIIGAAQPRPLGPQALAEGAAQGDIGPTVTNAARLEAMQQNPTRQGYTPVPLQNLSTAAAAGVNIDPFLKLNEAARPDVMTVDAGDEIRLIDKRTMQVIQRVPKKGAPGSVPFEMSDLTPEVARKFTLTRTKTGAPRTTVDVTNPPPEKKFEWEDKLRNDYKADVKAFREVEDAHRIIKGALSNPSPANDMAAATKFMKLLDPGSVVRESELAMAMQATGVLDRIANYHNLLLRGQKLTPQQRQDFSNAADIIYRNVQSKWREMDEIYDATAQSYGLNPDRVRMGSGSSRMPVRKRYNPETGKFE